MYLLCLLWIKPAVAFSIGAAAQSRTDSLVGLLQKASHDSTKLRLCAEIAQMQGVYRLSYWDSLEQEAYRKGAWNVAARAAGMQSKVYVERNDDPKALSCLLRAYNLRDKLGKEYAYDAILDLATFYNSKSRSKEALKYCYDGIRLAEAQNDRFMIAKFYAHASLCFFFAGDINRAVAIHRRCLKMYQELNCRDEAVDMLLAIGADYHALKKEVLMATYYLECKKYLGEIKRLYILLEVHHAIGVAYQVFKQWDSCHKYLQLAYDAAKREPDPRYKVSLMASLASYHLKRGGTKEARLMAEEAWNVLTTIDFEAQKPDLAKLLKEIYVKEGNYKRALWAQEALMSARDSVSNEQLRQQVREKEYNYQMEKKEDENKLLSRENQVKALELNQSRYQLLAFLVFFVVVLGLGWLLLAQNKLRAEHTRVQLEQRLLRSQMNPHFIFNSLNSIRHFVMSGENHKAEHYIDRFSTLIRDLLESNTREGLTLEEELEILKGYLQMESLRFSASFDYTIEVDTDLRISDIHIPHLMVQPFVENAIWHGLLQKEGTRTLAVHFRPGTEHTICCHIDDNGIGRKASRRRSHFRKKSMAMELVQQRLELIAKTRQVSGRIEIKDKEDGEGKSLGTCVQVFIPILKQ